MPTASLIQARPLQVEATDVFEGDALAVPVLRQDDELVIGPGAAELEEQLGIELLELLEGLGATAAAGEVTRVPARDRRVFVVGLGEGTSGELRTAGANLARACRGVESVTSSVAALTDADGLEAFVAGAVLGSFQFSLRTGETSSEQSPLSTMRLWPTPQGVDRARAIAEAAWTARWLATVPSNIKSPAWLADQAVELAGRNGLTSSVWDEVALEKGGFGGIVAVGRGSATPPRLVQLDYEPDGASRRTPRVVLVGKGITFDTGGLSIKPGEAMVNMKRDMTGAAVVAGVMSGLRAVGCPVRVTALLPCAENAIGADAMRPGDVIRHYGGTTTEVTNTDAEGRLVMADALGYAVDELDPVLLVDVATLTGAMKVALGLHIGGFFATDDSIAAHVTEASRTSGERIWRMPLVEDYEDLVRSRVADLDNSPGPSGAAITAALFLRHFTGGRPWAHFDVASVGDVFVEHDEWTVGPSGFGVRLLLHWLGKADPLEGITR